MRNNFHSVSDQISLVLVIFVVCHAWFKKKLTKVKPNFDHSMTAQHPQERGKKGEEDELRRAKKKPSSALSYLSAQSQEEEDPLR